MKLKSLFLGSFALTAMLFAQSCGDKDETPSGAPSVEIAPATLTFDATSSTQSVEVKATRDWKATPMADWISVNPEKGAPSNGTKLEVTVLSNDGADRTGVVKVTIGFDSKELKFPRRVQARQLMLLFMPMTLTRQKLPRPSEQVQAGHISTSSMAGRMLQVQV